MFKVLNNPNVSKNFKLQEFVCKCGCGQTMLSFEGVTLLQMLRDYFGKPVRINSPYRCEKHNKAVGGAKNSYHVKGEAYDIKVEGIHPLEVAKAALVIGFMGVGVYTHNGNWFTHVDVRDKKTLWVDVEGSKTPLYVSKF